MPPGLRERLLPWLWRRWWSRRHAKLLGFAESCGLTPKVTGESYGDFRLRVEFAIMEWGLAESNGHDLYV